jgi:hypothetical protein
MGGFHGRDNIGKILVETCRISVDMSKLKKFIVKNGDYSNNVLYFVKLIRVEMLSVCNHKIITM